MDSEHVRVRPCENIFVLLEHFLEVLLLIWLQEGIGVNKMIFFLRDLNGLQEICYQGILIHRVL